MAGCPGKRLVNWFQLFVAARGGSAILGVIGIKYNFIGGETGDSQLVVVPGLRSEVEQADKMIITMLCISGKRDN